MLVMANPGTGSETRASTWRLALIGLLLAGCAQAAGAEGAKRPEPEVFGQFDGDPMYSVLPLGAIPAIEQPEFVSGEEAARQMSPDEAILGVVIGAEAHAYSQWQLDSHEIVNDVLSGTAIAATW